MASGRHGGPKVQESWLGSDPGMAQIVTCFPSISRALRVSSGNGLRPPLTSSLRKHSGQKPRARQRAWPGYGAIPCTARAVTGQIPGAAGHRRRVRPQATGQECRSRPGAAYPPLPGDDQHQGDEHLQNSRPRTPGAAAPDPACMAPVAPLFHPLPSYADAAGDPCTQSQWRPPKRTAPGDNGPAPTRPKTWQLSGLGETCTPPSPGPELWISPGTCQERLRRRYAMDYAHS